MMQTINNLMYVLLYLVYLCPILYYLFLLIYVSNFAYYKVMDGREKMSDNWHEYNKRYLAIKIKEIQEKLKSYLEKEQNVDDDKNKNKSKIKNENDNGKNNTDDILKNKNQLNDASFNDAFVTDEK